MSKTKDRDWEQAWLDGQTYSWTNLADWAEHASGAVVGTRKSGSDVDHSDKEWLEQSVGVPPNQRAEI